MTAYEVLERLQKEVGSRRAGTNGEKKALGWLKSQCEAIQLPVELDEFMFIGSEYYRPMLTLSIMTWILVSIALSLFGYGTVSLIAFAVLFVFLTFFLKRIDVRLAKTPSQNVLAGLTRPFSEYIADPDKGTAVLVCGHYDTPRNFPPLFRKLRGGMRFLGPLAILGLLFFIFEALISTIWNSLGTMPTAAEQLLSVVSWLALILAIPFLVLMFFMTLLRMLGQKSDSPGTDDNGSGTALVLSLAQRFKENPTQNIELFFGWWGAEEMGLFGSRQFVRQAQDQLDKDKLHIINADCVGVGEYLTVHTGQGTLNRKAADQATVTRLETAAKKHSVKTSRSWESIISGGSSDQAGWIDRGFMNTTLILRANKQKLPLPSRIVGGILRIPNPNQYELDHIHSPDDTLGTIKQDVLESSADVAEAYVRAIDDEEVRRAG
jgi:hypothetical protein